MKSLAILMLLICSITDVTHAGGTVGVNQERLYYSLSLLAASAVYEQSVPKEWPVTKDFPTQDFDESARRVIHGNTGHIKMTQSELTAKYLSDIGVATLGASPIYEWFSERNSQAILIFESLAVTNVITNGMKYSARRPRPRTAFVTNPQLTRDSTASFPSGHSSTAFAAATALTLAHPEYSTLTKTGLYSVAGFVGFMRMAADKHYLTDITVGALVGILSANIVFDSAKNQNGLSFQINDKSIGFFLAL